MISYKTCAFSIGILSVSAVYALQNDGDRLAQIQEKLSQMQGQIKQLEKEVWELTQHQKAPLKLDAKANHNFVGQAKPEDKNSPVTMMSSGFQPPESSQQNLYSAAMTFLKEHRFSEAENSLDQFIKSSPHDPMVLNAYYWRAEIYYIQGNYPQAALLFGEAYEAYLRQKNTPTAKQANSKAPEIMLKLASSLASIEKYKDSQVILQEMDKEFKTIPGNIQQQADLLRREIARNTT